MPTETRQSKDTAHWDRYWSAPRAAACFEGAGSGYSADILDTWEHFFRQLPRGARVLDIGTGNGAIAVAAQKVSDDCHLDFQVTGVDSADIDPHRFLAERDAGAQNIEFRGRTDATALPFETGSYDALCAQYALEYMDAEAVLRELFRVAAPGAQLQAVLHSVPGVTEQAAAEELALADFLLEELDITGLARRTQQFITGLERSGRAPTPQEDAQARALIADFEAALTRLRRRIEETRGNIMLRNTMEVLLRSYQERAHFSPDQLDANVSAVELEIRAHAARLQELRGAARSESQLEQFCQQCVSAGFATPSTRALVRATDGAQLGWLLTTTRP